ncbi:hypothetical protein [Bradyrhizobium nanningense]|uniref:hypothetical protein n=1 Tax=Bradyrhizobium nanningense TaxID=1325118 RepID=UPI001008B4F9|nr:hypothetical protein [Bradyrhizobium nanningense]
MAAKNIRGKRPSASREPQQVFANIKSTGRLVAGFGSLLLMTVAIGGRSMPPGGASESLASVVRQKGHVAEDERIEKQIFEARMHV